MHLCKANEEHQVEGKKINKKFGKDTNTIYLTLYTYIHVMLLILLKQVSIVIGRTSFSNNVPATATDYFWHLNNRRLFINNTVTNTKKGQLRYDIFVDRWKGCVTIINMAQSFNHNIPLKTITFPRLVFKIIIILYIVRILKIRTYDFMATILYLELGVHLKRDGGTSSRAFSACISLAFSLHDRN